MQVRIDVRREVCLRDGSNPVACKSKFETRACTFFRVFFFLVGLKFEFRVSPLLGRCSPP
jgi:hypothetical protein